MKKLSPRKGRPLLTVGPDLGFCAICRNYKKLTNDHVPPKGCGNIENLLLKRLFGRTLLDENFCKATGGLHYKTLCSQCNNKLLGAKYDGRS